MAIYVNSHVHSKSKRDTPSVTVSATVHEQYLTSYFGSLNEILASLVCT
jgi:hypothetical protein